MAGSVTAERRQSYVGQKINLNYLVNGEIIFDMGNV